MPKAKRSVKRQEQEEGTYFDRLEDDIKSNQNTLSLVLGALIVIVVGILIFNYFNKPKQEISSDSTQTEQPQTGDVNPNNLPGKYTIKEGDTLFSIADKYYGDGYKYEEIAKANNIPDVDSLQTGQEITVPKLEGVAAASPTATAVAAASTEPQATPNTQPVNGGTGGNDSTVWGAKIEGDNYTVVEGDWLSTIAARAYGDVMAYDKIAKANNISNPDVIVPGMSLKLPR